MSKGKDPAFLFYPGDASEDTQFMNRLERGCYFDLLKAQKKFKKFNLALIQKVLGNDFQQCWPAIESVLIKEGDLYFIGWVNDAIENRAEHSAKQKKRIDEYWAKKRAEEYPDSNQNDSTELPKHNHGNTLENESEDGNENAFIKIIKEQEKKVERLEAQIDFTKPDIQGDEIIFPIDSKPVRDLWAGWKKSRWENHNARYAMMAEQAELKRLEGMDFNQINETILAAIAGEWKNLYPGKKNGTSKTAQRTDSVNARREAFARKYGSPSPGDQ